MTKIIKKAKVPQGYSALKQDDKGFYVALYSDADCDIQVSEERAYCDDGLNPEECFAYSLKLANKSNTIMEFIKTMSLLLTSGDMQFIDGKTREILMPKIGGDMNGVYTITMVKKQKNENNRAVRLS